DQESLERGDPAYRGHRIDSITVVSINPQPPYDVAMFSVPRFLSNYPLPEGMGDGRRNNDWDWLGHLFRRAEDGGPAERALRSEEESLERGDPAYRGHRIDSITVVSINPQPPYDVAMFSVPRFLSNYPLPEGMGDGRRNNDWDWLGHLFRRAEDGGPAERAL